MFALVGYRTPTIQRVRLGAQRDGTLTAIAHDVVEQTSTLEEFAEQTAVATRMMYAAPNRRTTHRLGAARRADADDLSRAGRVPGDVRAGVARWTSWRSRAGSIRSSCACATSPPSIPRRSTRSAAAASSRACARARSGSAGRARSAAARAPRRAAGCIGTGVAASTYPTRRRPSQALIRVDRDGNYTVLIDASDIGTGTWTALRQIAADALDVPSSASQLRDRRQRAAEGAERRRLDGPGVVGHGGLRCRAEAARAAARRLRRRRAGRRARSRRRSRREPAGEAATRCTPTARSSPRCASTPTPARCAFRGCSASSRVGRIINAKTGRSQLLGGMTMGLSMALHEESVLDPRFGDYVEP